MMKPGLASTVLLAHLLLAASAANNEARATAAPETITGCRSLITGENGAFTPDPTCWDTLDMQTWLSVWNHTTTTCPIVQSPDEMCQCKYGEPWATCFMRLTFAKNQTAKYQCSNVTAPQECSKPTPGSITSGPAEVYYGAYSIWSLTQYISTWYTVLTSPSALPAITVQLRDPTKDFFSTSTLLSDLVQQYANDSELNLFLADAVVATDSPNQQRPTGGNAQQLLGGLLSDTLNKITDDFISGNFLTLASGGMLLNSTGVTIDSLTDQLKQPS